MTPPILVFAVGNDSRGDDALGPLLIRKLEGVDQKQVELIEDYQLQVEHVTDLVGRSAVLFVDADMSCSDPYCFSEISAGHDHSYTSHAMTPFSLLHAYRQVYGTDAPPGFLLRITGYRFELGDNLSEKAVVNLEEATARVVDLCRDVSLERWRKCLAN